MIEEMNISLPSPLKKWVERQATKQGYGTANKYVLDVLRREKALEARDKIDAKLLQAINSGPSAPMTATDWNHIRTEGRRLARKLRKK